MGNKARGTILGVLGQLQKSITFDECNRNKTYYDGVKHGIKLSKKAIENIPREELEGKKENIPKKCEDCKWNNHGVRDCIPSECDKIMRDSK